MGCNIPGSTCQHTKPVDTKDGTNALCASPKPGPSLGPEDVSDEIGASYMPVQTRLCLDGAQMQVLAALRSHRADFVAAEQNFRIDRRAIAGAIAWEMLKNPPDWKRKKLRAVSPIPRSVGWGKVHLYNFSATGAAEGGMIAGPIGALVGLLDFNTIAKEAEEAGYLPKMSFSGRKRMLATPEGAIKYVAGIMAAIADLAGRYGFDDIRNDPSILTNVYQAETLTTWEDKLRQKTPGTPFVAANDMALWVGLNLGFLEDAVDGPDVPDSPPASAPDAKKPSPPKASKLDKDKFVKWMDDHAAANSQHACAKFVRQGLEAGGFNTDGRPNLAKDYGPFLIKLGAVEQPADGYTPQAGDLVVFEGADGHPIGHVQVYDGKQWVSDFTQNSFNPYHDDTPSKAYRFP